MRMRQSFSQTVNGEDGRIASIRDVKGLGYGVRVLYNDGWGFTASSIISLLAPRCY